MSAIGDVLAAVRKVLLLEHRVEALGAEVERLSAAYTDTRERLIRLEVIIEEARRAASERRSARGQIEQ
jgi:hypothetical protein